MRSQSQSANLLYLSSSSTGNVYVFTYPGGQLVGTLTGLDWSAQGECVDSSGDVFITTSSASGKKNLIYEYAHGGTDPIATLNNPTYAYGCAVDPTTGNLAVSGADTVAIYKNATGTPKTYSSTDLEFFFCGYDDAGNLYLTAANGDPSQVELIRLANGSSTFQPISLKATLYNDSLLVPSVQWDGKQMTVSSVRDYKDPLTIYRLRILGTTATVAGTTHLKVKHNSHAGQSWIQGKTVIGIETLDNVRTEKYRDYSNASLWAFPKGGEPHQSITRIEQGDLFGVTISAASSPSAVAGAERLR